MVLLLRQRPRVVERRRQYDEREGERENRGEGSPREQERRRPNRRDPEHQSFHGPTRLVLELCKPSGGGAVDVVGDPNDVTREDCRQHHGGRGTRQSESLRPLEAGCQPVGQTDEYERRRVEEIPLVQNAETVLARRERCHGNKETRN